MKGMKIAISMPDRVFAAGEQLAQQLGVSRSQLYADALAAYLDTRGALAVTARLNSVYGTASSKLDPQIDNYQLRRLADEAW
jgi:metal-responsive CopG/Arc/MetJ family transcriptional regulator